MGGAGEGEWVSPGALQTRAEVWLPRPLLWLACHSSYEAKQATTSRPGWPGG